MKQMTNKIRLGQLFTRLMILMLAISTNHYAAQAQDSINYFGNGVQYIGIANGKLFFQVDYKDDNLNGFLLEIQDQHGYQFYHEQIRSKRFRKQFAIEKSEIENNTISFVIAQQNNIRKQSFFISTSVQVTEGKIVKQ